MSAARGDRSLSRDWGGRRAGWTFNRIRAKRNGGRRHRGEFAFAPESTRLGAAFSRVINPGHARIRGLLYYFLAPGAGANNRFVRVR
jgi:hypothetical protein